MPPTITKDWQQEVTDRIDGFTTKDRDMASANADMIRRVIKGMGPDKNAIDPMCGARVVMNIPAVHVASFCNQQTGGYKNTYDLKKTRIMGELPPGSKIPMRVLVDCVLSNITNIPPKNIYFGAVEVNGTGIRFYGDFCLVLTNDIIGKHTVILNSNSYDLVRPPITKTGVPPCKATLQPYASAMAGLWASNTSDMAILKAFDARNASQRRLTTGQISEAVIDDEDYLEVLKIGSFNATELQEARVSAADAAAEGQITEQLRLGTCPSLADLQWRKHRRAAVKALQARGVRTRVITTSGRVRT